MTQAGVIWILSKQYILSLSEKQSRVFYVRLFFFHFIKIRGTCLVKGHPSKEKGFGATRRFVKLTVEPYRISKRSRILTP